MAQEAIIEYIVGEGSIRDKDIERIIIRDLTYMDSAINLFKDRLLRSEYIKIIIDGKVVVEG